MRTNSTKIGLMAGFLALSTAACIDDQPTGLNIRDVIDPEAPECKIDPAATLIRNSGTLDLIHPASTSTTVSTSDPIPSYWLPIRMSNNLGEEGDLEKLQINEDGREYQVDTFKINVIGYNVCIALPQDDDPFRHCEDIPESLSYFKPSSAYVPQENDAVDLLEVVNGKQLMDFLGDVSTLDYYGTTLVAHIVALGRMENGKTLQSNEFLFPIKVCAGCRKVTCGSGTEISFENSCFAYQDHMPTCEANK